MGFSHQDATDQFDNSLSVIKGGTDNTSIGNVSDRLKVSPPPAASDSLESFEAYAASVAPAQNKSMIALLNASSTKILKIREIFLTNVQTAAVTGVMLNFQLNRITGFTGGTALTPFPYDLSVSLGASISAATGATVSGEGSTIRRWVFSSDEHGVGANDVESFDYTPLALNPIFRQTAITGPLVLRQNQGITLKQTVSSTVGSFDINVIFTQE